MSSNMPMSTKLEQGGQLIVGSTAIADNSIIVLSYDTLRTTRLNYGDLVKVRSKRKSTVLVVLGDSSINRRLAHISYDTRANLHLRIGENVEVKLCRNVAYIERMSIKPLACCSETPLGLAFDTHLLPYFRDTYRPLKQGDIFSAGLYSDTIMFEVVQLQPSRYGIVTKNTIIYYNKFIITVIQFRLVHKSKVACNVTKTT